MSHRACGWLRKAVSQEDVRKLIAKAVRNLRKVEFDTIAFRGLSGALIAPIVAYKLKKEIIMIRKSDSKSHSHRDFEGFIGVKKYIVLDDLVSSGDTVAQTIKRVQQEVFDAKFVGLYTYHSSEISGKAGFHKPDSGTMVGPRSYLDAWEIRNWY